VSFTITHAYAVSPYRKSTTHWQVFWLPGHSFMTKPSRKKQWFYRLSGYSGGTAQEFHLTSLFSPAGAPKGSY